MDREISQGIVRGKAFLGEGRECSKFLRGEKKSELLWSSGKPGWCEQSGREGGWREKELRMGVKL